MDEGRPTQNRLMEKRLLARPQDAGQSDSA
jgi:hypothetical protein